MSTLDLMWRKFEAHQPFADERGYGEAWRRMCEERAVEAATAAWDATRAAAWDAAAEYAAAVDAAAWAAWAAADAAWAERWAKRAIEDIERAGGRS